MRAAGPVRRPTLLDDVRRSWAELVGPETTAPQTAAILGVAVLGGVAAPLVVRLRGGGPLDQAVASAIALDLWGGALANNTLACARWYERPGQGDAEHLRFAAAHVHPAVVAWLDRAEPRRVPPWAWAGAHYAYLLAATAAIRRWRRHRVPLGVALTLGGVALDVALGPSRRAPWFAGVFYPKLLLGHAAAARWSEEALAQDVAIGRVPTTGD